jgi:hypothetical protein
MLDKIRPERREPPKVVIKEGASKQERKDAEREVVRWKADEAQRVADVLEKKKTITSVRFFRFLSSPSSPRH